MEACTPSGPLLGWGVARPPKGNGALRGRVSPGPVTGGDRPLLGEGVATEPEGGIRT